MSTAVVVEAVPPLPSATSTRTVAVVGPSSAGTSAELPEPEIVRR
jgi:hypothetical protein